MIEHSFIGNSWYVAGWAAEFKRSAAAGRLIIDQPIVVYRTDQGRVVALEDRCAHRWAPLSKGRVEGNHIRCMYHGVKFDCDGQGREVPGQDRVGRGLCVRAYPVIERHRFVWVWMGEPSLADPGLVPDLSVIDQAWRHFNYGSLDYQANYSLVNDNLLDLSHIGFLHENTLGRRLEALPAGSTRPTMSGGMNAEQIEAGVRFDSWSSHRFRTVVLPKKIPYGDLWTRTEFLLPGIFVSNWRIYPDGTAEQCNGRPPGAELVPLSDSMSVQAVVPMSARATRYLFSIGHRELDMDEAEAAAIWAVVQEGFAEDLQMIQAQQKVIDDHPGRRMAGIVADRGLVMYRNLVQRRLAAERAAEGRSG